MVAVRAPLFKMATTPTIEENNIPHTNMSLSKQQYFLQPSIAVLPKRQQEAKWLSYQRKKNRLNNQRGLGNPTPQPKPNPLQKVRRTRMSFTDCLVSYARACIDPFDQSIKEACIPDNNAMPSHKFSSLINAQAVVGTQGVCIIGLNPWAMTARDYLVTPVFVDAPLIVSNAAYSSTTIDFDRRIYPAQLDVFNSNSFYSADQVRTQSMRLVGAAVEIFYTGPTLSQAGAVTMQQTPGLTPVPLGTTFAAVRNDPRSRTCSVSKGSRCYVAYTPIADDLLSYKPNNNYLPTTGQPVNPDGGTYTPLIIVISGATPGTTFQVKAIAHFEALYPGMGTTPSHSDPIGFPSFMAARAAVKSTDDPSRDFVDVMKETAKTVARNLSPYLPMAGAAIGAFVGQPTIGASVGSATKSVLDVILDGQSTPI